MINGRPAQAGAPRLSGLPQSTAHRFWDTVSVTYRRVTIAEVGPTDAGRPSVLVGHGPGLIPPSAGVPGPRLITDFGHQNRDESDMIMTKFRGKSSAVGPGGRDEGLGWPLTQPVGCYTVATSQLLLSGGCDGFS